MLVGIGAGVSLFLVTVLIAYINSIAYCALSLPGGCMLETCMFVALRNWHTEMAWFGVISSAINYVVLRMYCVLYCTFELQLQPLHVVGISSFPQTAACNGWLRKGLHAMPQWDIV